MKKEVIVKCHICSYEWVTTSDMLFVTCPSCRNKTKRIKNETQD